MAMIYDDSNIASTSEWKLKLLHQGKGPVENYAAEFRRGRSPTSVQEAEHCCVHSRLCPQVCIAWLHTYSICQDKQRASSTSSSKSLEPWLLGLTAMVVFLFIVFILMIINRVWCKKKKNEYEEDYSNKQRVDMNVYTNDGLEAEPAYEEMTEKPQNKAKWENENEEQKITEM
ncbi:PDZK1-interacting protein 1-like [Hyperolius riggenbachi]|uniref:PDZK1-interacting protein 1-like n=1 Tax=Hyperolius riggenbachi TaxID=752182 RepID=UPI0035A2654C